jgi:hypothetical protein
MELEAFDRLQAAFQQFTRRYGPLFGGWAAQDRGAQDLQGLLLGWAERRNAEHQDDRDRQRRAVLQHPRPAWLPASAEPGSPVVQRWWFEWSGLTMAQGCSGSRLRGVAPSSRHGPRPYGSRWSRSNRLTAFPGSRPLGVD